MSERKISRRKFLQGALLGVAGAAAAACQPQTVIVETEKIVKETVEVEKIVETEKEVTRVVEKSVPASGPKMIRIMLSSWAVAEVPFDQMAREFSDKREDLEVKIDTSVDDTKLMAQISADEVEWCGLGIITPFLDIVRRVESGLIQPMDEFIESSSEEGAGELLTDMIPSVKEDSSYKGYFYSIPYSFENITFNWRNDYFQEVGQDARPETWNEWYEISKDLKTWGEAEEITPTSWVGALWTDCGALICSAMEQPYTEEGMLDWMAPETIEALKFYRKLVDEELTPDHGFDGWFESYQRGKLASVQAQSSRGVWGQNIHGQDKVTTSPIPTLEKGGGSGTVYWGNGLGIINKAPYPQEVVDFYVYAFGPANLNFQKAVIRSGKTPIYNSAYTDIIDTDPMFGTYKWMKNMRDDVARSTPVPRNTFYLIQHQMYQNWIVQYIEDPNMTPEECAQHILDDSQAEIAKQKIQ
jgi:ABC-type glycerol-3-phosphate transport system substrate-binding protein